VPASEADRVIDALNGRAIGSGADSQTVSLERVQVR
jgi:hypothetical protein